MRVTLRGGSVLAKKVGQPMGRTAEVALPPERLREKFDNCARRVLPAANIARLHAAIEDLENVKDVRAVNAAMEPAAGRATFQRAGASLTS